MSADNVVYANNALLFTLKGSIIVQYLDGETVAGEFATQDAFNIFIEVDGEFLMIPRQQIRFIKSVTGQAVEKDSSQEQIVGLNASDTQPLPEAVSSMPPPIPVELEVETELPIAAEQPDVAPDEPLEASEADAFAEEEEDAFAEEEDDDDDDDEEEDDDDDDDEDEGTLILTPGQTLPSLYEVEATADDDDDDDEEDGTLILALGSQPPSVPAATEITNESLRYVDEDEFTAEADDDEMDMTVVLGDEADLDLGILGLAQSEETSATATLTITEGPHSGQTFTLGDSTTTIGRSSDNVVVLSSDKEASRHHAIIILEAGQFVLQDQNSLNGTFVNEMQVTAPHSLTNGDRILVGVSWFTFEQ
jgi:hypothetical protein